MKEKFTTKKDLIKSIKKVIKEDYDVELNELGSEEYHMTKGGLEPGAEPAPEPHRMAHMVINRMNLHPDYYENEELMSQFIEALYEMLKEKNEEGDIKAKDYEAMLTNPMKDKSRLNESRDELKRVFKKFKN